MKWYQAQRYRFAVDDMKTLIRFLSVIAALAFAVNLSTPHPSFSYWLN
ncbi:MAG: hypothetical protein KME21_04245 [Desmonostoc vinosum HA7617-LM4]|nr:hypothetical protein [Desmonostoc vinosum HA7617-LM4]